MGNYLDIIIKLFLAGILGGIVGYEREHTNRPAGFRTHILVCVGSALVMVTSVFIFDKYKSAANIDPARLGAQVISGIGFLGAGTIIREGFSVKGLTTAASLWAVSCVGIAAGIGFYEGAIIATILIFLTLVVLKKTEQHFAKKDRLKTIIIQSDNIPGQVGIVSCIFDKYNIIVKNIEFINNDNNSLLMKLLITSPDNLSNKNAMNDLQGVQGVKRVHEE